MLYLLNRKLPRTQTLTKDVLIGANANVATNMGTISVPAGYKFAGVFPAGHRYVDALQVTYDKNNGNSIYAYIKSYYGASNLEDTLNCTVLYLPE